MQQRLIELKYLTGGADGIFGPTTFLALQSFQSNNKLQADGVAGSLTLAKLSDPKAMAAGGAAPLPTPTPAPAQAVSPVFTAPLASEVRFGDWSTEVRARLRSMPKVIIYDFMSGAHYNINVFSVGRHADGEPPTKQDTEIMEKALGYNNWDPRPVWVVFSDGRVYMGSTHSHGHEVDHNASNGLTGHICIHFPRDMAEAESTGPMPSLTRMRFSPAGIDQVYGQIRRVSSPGCIGRATAPPILTRRSALRDPTAVDRSGRAGERRQVSLADAVARRQHPAPGYRGHVPGHRPGSPAKGH